MTVSSMMKIGREMVDLDQPCDVVAALRKVEIAIIAGQKSEMVRFGDDQVTFTRANLDRLAALIRTYEDRCQRATTGRRTRFAKSMRFG